MTKEKVQKHKQRSTKRTYKTKDLVTSYILYILYTMNNYVYITNSFARQNKKLVRATKIKKSLTIPKGLYAFVS